MALRKDQRNDVFQAIEGRGLSPEEFEWGAGADESTLRHLPTRAYFSSGGVAGNYSSRYLAGDGPVEERRGMSEYRLMDQVGFWLGRLKLDIDTPDLWAQLQRERELLAAVSNEDIENTPFTPAEREEIAEQRLELKQQLTREHSLSKKQARLLEERLDYLVDAAGRVGRKDWFLMAGTVVFSYVLAAELPLDSVRHILGTLLASIGHILWGGHLPWPGPLGLPGGG
jgi:hypothetical protein